MVCHLPGYPQVLSGQKGRPCILVFSTSRCTKSVNLKKSGVKKRRGTVSASARRESPTTAFEEVVRCTDERAGQVQSSVTGGSESWTCFLLCRLLWRFSFYDRFWWYSPKRASVRERKLSLQTPRLRILYRADSLAIIVRFECSCCWFHVDSRRLRLDTVKIKKTSWQWTRLPVCKFC